MRRNIHLNEKERLDLIKIEFEKYQNSQITYSLKCPICDFFSDGILTEIYNVLENNEYIIFASFLCNHCKNHSIITYNFPNSGFGEFIYPIQGTPNRIDDFNTIHPEKTDISKPNDDLNEKIKQDYYEASFIYKKSPRGACALLRLCLQNLMKQLGENGDNLNDDIASLVKKGLDPDIIIACDIIRVIGNNAVHPGEINIKDDINTAKKLFSLLNYIADIQITQKKKLKNLYETTIPEKSKISIEKRNKMN
jgi:hypothetical protein